MHSLSVLLANAGLLRLAMGDVEPAPSGEPIATTTVVLLAALFVIGVLFIVGLIRSHLYICRPNEMLIVSGKRHRVGSSEATNFTVILAGTHLQIPVLQKVARMDLRVIPIEINVTKVLSNGGIPLDIHAIANVKISSDPRFVYNAVERFLGLPR